MACPRVSSPPPLPPPPHCPVLEDPCRPPQPSVSGLSACSAQTAELTQRVEGLRRGVAEEDRKLKGLEVCVARASFP